MTLVSHTLETQLKLNPTAKYHCPSTIWQSFGYWNEGRSHDKGTLGFELAWTFTRQIWVTVCSTFTLACSNTSIRWTRGGIHSIRVNEETKIVQAQSQEQRQQQQQQQQQPDFDHWAKSIESYGRGISRLQSLRLEVIRLTLKEKDLLLMIVNSSPKMSNLATILTIFWEIRGQAGEQQLHRQQHQLDPRQCLCSLGPWITKLELMASGAVKEVGLHLRQLPHGIEDLGENQVQDQEQDQDQDQDAGPRRLSVEVDFGRGYLLKTDWLIELLSTPGWQRDNSLSTREPDVDHCALSPTDNTALDSHGTTTVPTTSTATVVTDLVLKSLFTEKDQWRSLFAAVDFTTLRTLCLSHSHFFAVHWDILLAYLGGQSQNLSPLDQGLLEDSGDMVTRDGLPSAAVVRLEMLDIRFAPLANAVAGRSESGGLQEQLRAKAPLAVLVVE